MEIIKFGSSTHFNIQICVYLLCFHTGFLLQQESHLLQLCQRLQPQPAASSPETVDVPIQPDQLARPRPQMGGQLIPRAP